MTSPNQASVGNVHADIVPDVTGFKAALEAKLGKLKLDPFEIRVDADTKAAAATLAAFRKTVATAIDIPIDIDTRRAATRLAAFRTTASRPIDIPVDVSTRTGAGSLSALRAAVRTRINIPVDLDTRAAMASYAALRAVVGSPIDIHVDLDTGTAAASLAAFIAAYRSAIAGLPPIRPGGAGSSGRAGASDGGAYAAAFRAAVTQASRDLPAFRVTLNRDPVQRAVNEIQRDLARLASQRVGIEISATDALAEAQRLRVELARLQAISPITEDVRLDARAAELTLARLEAQLANIGRDRTANVRINANRGPLDGLQAALLGSTSRIQLLITAGLALGPAIVPAAAAAAAAIASIGGAAVSVVAGLGVGVLAISGVVGAVRALNEAAADQAKTQETLGRQDTQLASGADQVRSAVASLANTRAQAASQARQSANQIADAERNLAEAQRDYLRVQQDLNRAREEAADSLEDLNSAVKNNSLSIRQAKLDLADAEKALRAVANQPIDSRARVEAQLAYDRARQSLDDLTLRQGRLKEEQTASAKAGVEGSQQVTAAQDRIRDAQRRVQDAERAVTEARTQAAEQARQSAFSIAQAQQAVVAAQRSAAQSVASAAATTGGAMDELQRKMDALSPAGQRFARFIVGLQPELLTLRRNAEQALPGLQRGIEEILPNLPKLNDFVRRVGLELGKLGTDIGLTLNSNRVRPFFTYIDATAVPTMDSLARSAGRVGIGFANLAVAFGPSQRQIVAGLEDMSVRFERFSAGLGENNNFQRFLNYAITRGPIVMRTINDIGGAIIHILEASAPAGDVLLTVLSTLSRVINAIPVPVLTALLATMTALRIAALLSAIPIGTLATNMRNVVTGTTTMRTAMGGLVSFLGGPWTIAIAAATLAIGAMISQSAKQRAEVDRLRTSLDSYGQALKDGVNRETLAHAQAILRQDAGMRGLVSTMQQLNISQQTLIAGLNGDRAAREVVVNALNTQIALEKALQREARGSSDAETETSLAHKRRAEELERMRIAFAKTNTANAEANELTRKWAEEASAASVATSVYGQRIETLERLLVTLTDKTATAKDVSEAFRRAIDDLTGATINNIEAEERQTQANIDLRKALADSSAGFDLQSAKTDANRAAVLRNRDALEAALLATREKMLADIAAGKSLEEARAANERRINEILKEIPASQRNTQAVKDLVVAYGTIPDEVATAMRVTGVEAVMQQLRNLKAAQLALDLNISGADAYARVASGNQYRVFAATGGPVYGPGGPTDDRVRAVLPTADGPIRYQLSPGEFIQPAASVDYYGQGFHEAIRRRAIPRDALIGHAIHRARGGPVEEWDFPVTASGTRIPSLDEVKSKVYTSDFGPGPGFPPWGQTPKDGGGYYDSGVWKSIHALVQRSGIPYEFGNSYRPGDPLWHGQGRAIDYMGYNQDRLASFFYNMRPRVLELIHRTNTADYGITRGRVRNFPTQFPLHRNHIHIAMADGGLVPVPRVTYDSGGPLAPGLTLADNRTGGFEYVNTADEQQALLTAAGRGGGVDMHIENFNAWSDQSPSHIARDLYWEMRTR